MSDPTPPLPYLQEEPSPVELYVVAPPARPKYWLHLLLLFLTLLTTLVVGARLEYNFLNQRPAFTLQTDSLLPMFELGWILEAPRRLLLGVPFAGSLMAILLAHEMGHYVFCVRYGVNATLPFFIPAPTLIGTLGAFIRIKSPIRSREALFDIGIAGPIAGFVVATIVLLISMFLSIPISPATPPSDIQFGMPLVFRATYWFVGLLRGGEAVPLSRLALHPTAIAAWVGMFATALNLLPGGQLDGGHIVYSVWPRAHRHIGNLVIGILLPLGFVAIFREKGWLDSSWSGWAGWLVWVVFIALSGLRHPIVPAYPGVGSKRKWLALVALGMFVLTFVPEPFRVNL